VKSSCECSNEPSSSIKCWELSSYFTTGGFSSSAQLHKVRVKYDIGIKQVLNG
jgi:hypothetical protein